MVVCRRRHRHRRRRESEDKNRHSFRFRRTMHETTSHVFAVPELYINLYTDTPAKLARRLMATGLTMAPHGLRATHTFKMIKRD